jgi:hypothetical protein
MMEFRVSTGRPFRTNPPRASRRGRAHLGPLARMGGMRAAAAPMIATGRDVTTRELPRARRGPSRGVWTACAAGGLLAALMLVQLRTESIDLRYRLARSLKSEQSLLEEQRRLVVDLRRLRHPTRLAEIGTALGLARPVEVRELATTGSHP